MNILIFFIYLLKLTHSKTLDFPHPLQRFVYDEITETIVLASVNRIYSLNVSDLTVIAEIDTSPSTTDQQCPNTNRTISSKQLFYFPTTSFLHPSGNETFNQLLLLSNQSIFICSSSNRGGACQERTLINLRLLRNSSQRLVASSPFSPSVGFISQTNQLLYLSTTYDPSCDPFYEIPTISGRHLFDEQFLSTIHFNAGQSALQQSTYTLRLLNLRLIKEFFLHYLYAFEYKHFAYFLTIQQADLHHKHRLQTKLVRFCQTLKQPMMKSYVEIPLTCGRHYHYLITAKFSSVKQRLYGLFRNTTQANATGTSHAICVYSMGDVQEAFFQTIKRCLVDGRGRRGLGFLSPDTPCLSSKSLDEISLDSCPENDEGFFQYPIGGHRSIEQAHPLIELHETVNFTSLEIGFHDEETVVVLGDDRGTVYTFQASNTKSIHQQKFPSTIIVDLKLIHEKPTLKNAQLLVLTNNQIIKQNLSTCEQYETCHECSTAALCHWCSKERVSSSCTPTFECAEKKKRMDFVHICTNIERVTPARWSTSSSAIDLEVIVNEALRDHPDDYQCQFRSSIREEMYYTNVTSVKSKTVKCAPPVLTNIRQAVDKILLSLYDRKNNLTFGHYDLPFVNCSNIHSCSSCSRHPDLCVWHPETITCMAHDQRQSSVNDTHQCPSMYLKPSSQRLSANAKIKLTIHIEQCHRSLKIQSCRLINDQKRFIAIDSDPRLTSFDDQDNLCLLSCSFEATDDSQDYEQPFSLDLSIEFANQTSLVVPHTRLSLYHCARLALNCTSCLELDSSYRCIWCNNICMLNEPTMSCANKQQCVQPIIQSIDPVILPVNGGSLVTIHGSHFDLVNVSIHLADVPCQFNAEESTNEKIVCRSGNAGSAERSGFVRLKFGASGPDLSSRETISYAYPRIDTIEPMIGIGSGGTLLTIRGDNLTIGNGHLSIFIGHRPCQLEAVSPMKIECETSSFPPSSLQKPQPIKLFFDRQTQLTADHSFSVVADPILYSFDRYHQHQTFRSGGHRIVILGENLHFAQQIQLEFQHFLFVSSIFHNSTHLIFLTPPAKELPLNHQATLDLTLYLDNFNRTSSLIYVADPLIYPLEPILQPYSEQLLIQGHNLTAIGHTAHDISVQIGCDLCTVIQLDSDQIICQPPTDRPKKSSTSERLCYDSEHPSIVVTIDNIRVHVGDMIYPKKVLIVGLVSGCLFTLISCLLLVVLIFYLKNRYVHRRSTRRYLYTNSINPHEIDKEDFYEQYSPAERMIFDSTSVPLRSYFNYLQICYYSWDPLFATEDKVDLRSRAELFDQFQFFLEHNQMFIQCLLRNLLNAKSSNKKILIDLILTQRYNLKNLLLFNHDDLHLHICVLTFYQNLSINRIRVLFSQLYYQLKLQISQGPVDAIESRYSYYSLNYQSILNNRSLTFKPIQLIVHLYSPELQPITRLHLTCLTCDSISQVKGKILHQLKSFSQVSIEECQLYLFINPSYSSVSSASSSGSSSVPLTRKSLRCEASVHRTIKFSTTLINNESNFLCLHDVDQTNEQTNDGKRLNTLQHYGIISDGYEFRMILPKNLGRNADPKSTLNHQCSSCMFNEGRLFRYLSTPPASSSIVFPLDITHRQRYCHLFTHSYEEIDRGYDLSSTSDDPNRTARLFQTKAMIQPGLISLIEILFTDLRHIDTFLSESIEQYPRLLHVFYAHFIPFIIEHLHCLFDVPIDVSLTSSLRTLASIFAIACRESNEFSCSLCVESRSNAGDYLTEQCSLLFADEIERVRFYYSTLEQGSVSREFTSEYSSTNTGIETSFELDPSLIDSLMEYSSSHANEIVEAWRRISSDETTLSSFINLVQLYRSIGRT